MTPHERILTCFALAPSEHLDGAKANLLDSILCLETEECLDLLARIELCLGNETEARHLWTQVVETGTSNRLSRRALNALNSVIWKRRRAIAFARMVIIVAAFAFVSFFALCGIFISF